MKKFLKSLLVAVIGRAGFSLVPKKKPAGTDNTHVRVFVWWGDDTSWTFGGGMEGMSSVGGIVELKLRLPGYPLELQEYDRD